MPPHVDPVASDPTLPASARVVVIGGGIIGVGTTFFLASKGVPVVLCEKGEIAAEQSSRNWGNIGRRLPQLKVMSSVMRTEPLAGGPEASASGTGFGLRKRLDGGYTVANWSDNVFDLVPDAVRFMRDFLPLLAMQQSSIKLRLGRTFVDEWQTPRRWALDAVSPFEKVRTLDPKPHEPILKQAQTSLTAAFPVFNGMRIAERWGGIIDVTPDAVPVIAGVDTLPGFFIATFSSPPASPATASASPPAPAD